MQQGAVEAAVDLASQAAHVHVDDIGLRVEMVLPHAFEQHGARHDLVRPPHQKLEQTKLSRLQADGNTGTLDGAGQEVHLQIRELQVGGSGVALSPAQERLQARQQLGEREGFAQVVVSPRLEPRHPVVDLTERAQDEHR